MLPDGPRGCSNASCGRGKDRGWFASDAYATSRAHQRGSHSWRGCNEGCSPSCQSRTELPWGKITWIRIYRYATGSRCLGLGRISGLERHIRPYLNGRDLNQRSRGLMVIDLFGLSVDHVQSRFPEVYQWILNRVKPEREAKAAGGTRDSLQYARQWWLFGKTRNEFRPALSGLDHYTATTETSRHRFFVFLDASILSDNKLITIALNDGFYLGVLSSRLHVAYSVATGGWLGVGNDSVYVKTRCFETFPFPACPEAQKERIRTLAESLDNHRKRQQSQFSSLSITDSIMLLQRSDPKSR